MQKTLKNLSRFLGNILVTYGNKNSNRDFPNNIRKIKKTTNKLIKSKPAHLVRRNYELLENEKEIDQLFNRMMRSMFHISGVRGWRSMQNPPKIRAETGELSDKRFYFYLDPWEDIGWLFERAPYGWVISRADKIINQQEALGKQPWDGGVEANLFLREESWDAVTVYKPDDNSNLYRLSSRRMGKELVSFPVYEDGLKNDFHFIMVENSGVNRR